MAFPTDTYTAADLAASIPEIWSSKINDYFKCELVFAPFFTDRSSELAGGGDTLHTPGLVAMSANTKTNGQAVTLNSPADTSVDLVVDDWQEVSFAIEDKEAAQVMHSYVTMSARSKNAAYEIARALETKIASLFAGFSTSVGSSTSNIADSDIRNAISTLEANCVPGVGNNKKEVAFFFHPTVFWRQIQNIDKFSLAINAPVQDPVAKTPAYLLYGIPLYTSNLVPFASGSAGRVNVLAHPDAIHWATSALGSGGSKGAKVGASGIRVQANYIPDYLSTVVTADILMGAVENRDNAGVKILSSATFA
jgi:hypothetical protein